MIFLSLYLNTQLLTFNLALPDFYPTIFYMSSTRLQIPIIDIAPFLQNSTDEEKKIVAEKINDACIKYGVFLLKNHGINNKLMLSKMAEFFTLPQDVKDSISITPGGFTRGYIGMGKESGSDALEVKEAFSYGYAWPKDEKPKNNMQGENVWPDKNLLSSEWQSSMQQLFESMCNIANALTRAFSISYGKTENYLGEYCKNGNSISLMRLFHYFPYQKADKEFPLNNNRIGSSPHTDWGFLTLILQQEDCTGLQLNLDNEWHDLAPVPETLIVNCGDYFSLLTGGNYISPLHRVVSEGKERLSSVLFFYPDYDAKIPLLDGQSYSLFQDQKKGATEKDLHIDTNLSFGEFISEKWSQVQRKEKI